MSACFVFPVVRNRTPGKSRIEKEELKNEFRRIAVQGVAEWPYELAGYSVRWKTFPQLGSRVVTVAKM